MTTGVARVAVAALASSLLAGIANAETPLERGKYLMDAVAACGNCHTPQTPAGPAPGRELAGGTPFVEQVFTAYAPNITPDPETGIGRWTDAQLILAIREGKRPDGSIIGPPMPIALYRGMSDDDVKAIAAYIRSVPPIVNKVPKSEYRIPLPPSYGPAVGTVVAPSPDDKIAYGAYLAGPVAHCLECHSGPGPNGAPDFVNKTGAGGMAFTGPWGTTHAPNLTPLGLGEWTDAAIKTAVRTGVRPDGAHLKPPMGFAYYRNMRESDLDAIVAFLRTLPPK